MMRTGTKSGYWVIEWKEEFDPSLDDLVPRFPEIVAGHRVVIASFDSGPFMPYPAELEKGWSVIHEVAVSPSIDSLQDLPTAGFDEWYVYDQEVPASHFEAFVSYLGFSPLDEESLQAIAFWKQVEQLQPLHALGAGTPVMFFITRDEAMFKKICIGLRTL